MNDLGKLLMVVGLAIALVGAALWLGWGRGWFGQLPGDVRIERGNFSFHFPIVTCLLVSGLITFLLWFFRK